MAKVTPVKVRTILENFDFLGRIQVIFSEPDVPEDVYYDGSPLNCPYWIADLYLDTNANGEALSVGIGIDKKGNPEAILYIYIQDKDN